MSPSSNIHLCGKRVLGMRWSFPGVVDEVAEARRTWTRCELSFPLTRQHGVVPYSAVQGIVNLATR